MRPLTRSRISIPRILCGVLLVGLLVGFTVSAAVADDWPQWLGPKRDGVWRETGIVESFPKTGLDVRWRKPVGPGYTGPAVSEGRVYLLDRQPELDAAGKEVATADGSLPGKERVLALDAKNGDVVWEHAYDRPYKISYPSGPRATPTCDGNRVYTLGAMGDLICLESADGKVVWSKHLPTEYKIAPPVWGWAGHPLIDGDSLICLVGGKGSAVVALDKHTGRELWRSLTAEEIAYVPPVIYQVGKLRQLIIWFDAAVNGLNPATGEVYWSVPFPADGPPMRPAVPIAMPRLLGDLLFVTSFYDGPLMLKLSDDPPGAKVLWAAAEKDPQHKQGIYGLITTPVIKEGYIYGVSQAGELRCLKAETGELMWESFATSGGKKNLFATSFLIEHEDRFFIVNDRGNLFSARLTPKGYEELGRVQVLEPTQFARGREVVWSHPAFADRAMFARNDKELVCVELGEKAG